MKHLERRPLPPTPSPQRRGGEEECAASLPLSVAGRGLGGGVFPQRLKHLRLLLLILLTILALTALPRGAQACPS